MGTAVQDMKKKKKGIIYSVLIEKCGQISHSRPFRSFPEIYEFSGKTCLLFRQPEKSPSIQDIFSACPIQFSPSLSPQINDILLKPSPCKSILYFPCLLRQSLLGKTPKRLSISAEIPTASSFHRAFQPRVQQSSSAGIAILGQETPAQPLLPQPSILLFPETKEVNPKFQCANLEDRPLILFVIEFRCCGLGSFLQLFSKAPSKSGFTISWNEQF